MTTIRRPDLKGGAHVRALSIPFGWGECPWSNGHLQRNVRKARARGLPEVQPWKPHGRTLNICGGGPSLADTLPDHDGPIAAVNGAHDYLVSRGRVPQFCVLLDAAPILAKAVTPHERVVYLVASMCHPMVLDKLHGYRVELWHASQPGLDLDVPLQVGGGSTAALRAINLGYVMGFRRFKLFGMDSSFKEDGKHHAYDWHGYGNESVIVQGYPTTLGLYVQVCDFFRMMDCHEAAGDPITVSVHGEGLFQHAWRQHAGDEPYTTLPSVARMHAP